jgi:nicotinamidase-related amidase
MSANCPQVRLLICSVALLGLGLGLKLLVHADAPARKNAPSSRRTAEQKPASGNRIYRNQLKPIVHPQPLLADYPEFVQPVIEKKRYEAPVLIDEPGADLDVRAWRFSYNARGIIELPNHIRADRTAAIMVHPWGIDDGQGWRTPEPAGVADFCTPDKNHLAGRHTREVVDPLLKRLRGRVSLVLFSLRSHEYPAQAKIYRSIRHRPTAAERAVGHRELTAILDRFNYRGEPLPAELTLSEDHPVRDYFQQFPGLEAGARSNNAGFWDLPIPVTKDVEVFPDDVVYYDEDGYPALRDFLKRLGIRHVILTGYATDMCFCRTTAGYENLSKDFNVFLVGDATLATYPANETPRYATNAHISFASINQLITQSSWIRFRSEAQAKSER